MTDISVSEGKAAQLSAIEESGWGQPFRFLQPHNLAFWVYLLGVGGGALTMVRYFGPRAAFYTPALAGGVLLFGLYLVPWLLLLRHHNRFTTQPAGLLATGFVWGGIAATFWIALPANGAFWSSGRRSAARPSPRTGPPDSPHRSTRSGARRSGWCC
jgi:hypothetical protein